MQDQAKRRCDQHHADGDENRRNANHVARYALKSELPPPGKTRKSSGMVQSALSQALRA
jgi:hypothetical protein